MFRLFTVPIVLITLLNSCENSKRIKDDSYSLIKIDNVNIDTVNDISSIVDSISVSLLKEPDGNYMADIFKIGVTRNRKYLFFDLQTNKVNVFDRSGNFLRTLSKAGDGRDDPLNIGDFWVENDNEIQVYDYAQMKIINYDSQLNFKNSNRASQFNHFSGIERIPNSTNYAGYANLNMFNKPYKEQLYQIALMDKNLEVIDTYLHFDQQFRGVSLLSYAQHFTRFKDTLRFYKAYDNNVYSVSNSGITRQFRIAYVKKTLPDDIYPIIQGHLPEFKNRSKRILTKLPLYFDGYTRFNGHWYENDKFIHLSSFIHVKEGGNVFFTILDKRSNQILFNAKAFIENNKYKLRLPPFQYMDRFSNELLATVSGKNLKALLFQDSEFHSYVIDDPSLIYLVRIKLK